MAQHRFANYLLRMTGPEDLKLATEWTAADADHAGRVDPRFWLERDAHGESWLLHDAEGPLFFFKAVRFESQGQNILELHVQFSPVPEPIDPWTHRHHRVRTARALVDGTQWLERTVQAFHEMWFDSNNPVLIHFCEKHLGFTRKGGRLFKKLQACAEV